MPEENAAYYSRLPDFGPCEIEEWEEFLSKSKDIFYENWNKPFSHQETFSDFTKLALLGSGSFGDVILVKHNSKGTFCAMKAIEKEKIIKHKQLEHTKTEKVVMQCMNFPFTVYLMYFFKDNSYIYMLMPLMAGGELFTYLKKFGKFEEGHARFYVGQVILAIEYLHYLDLIYRDLKPENILIDNTGYLKVTDFGFCKRLTKDRTYTLCGTPEYLAPEVILNKGYGKSVDWWCIGVLIYELVAGSTPFYHHDTMTMYKKIIGQKYKMPSIFSSELKDLVSHILQGDLSRRYGNLISGVGDIKEHKWFRSLNWLAILNRRVKAPYQPKCKEPENMGHFDNNKLKQMNVAKENKYPEEFADF